MLSCCFNFSNAEATFVRSTRTHDFFENHFKPVMIEFRWFVLWTKVASALEGFSLSLSRSPVGASGSRFRLYFSTAEHVPVLALEKILCLYNPETKIGIIDLCHWKFLYLHSNGLSQSSTVLLFQVFLSCSSKPIPAHSVLVVPSTVNRWLQVA